MFCDRSVSHDSYFDMLQNSQHNSEGSLLDLSEIQLNFELEESEMRIFSEDESLVSSPRVHKDGVSRASPPEFMQPTLRIVFAFRFRQFWALKNSLKVKLSTRLSSF